jgi:hypothetical protein
MAVARKWKGMDLNMKAPNERDLGKFHSPRGCVMEWFHLVFSWNK